MKITLKTSSQEHILAGGAANQEEPIHLTISAQRTLQAVRAIRATSVQTYDRGNLQIKLTFEVGRLHESQSDAMNYMLIHASTITNAHGELLLQLEDPAARSLTLESATLASIQTRYNGNASYTLYEIYGGKLHVNQQ